MIGLLAKNVRIVEIVKTHFYPLLSALSALPYLPAANIQMGSAEDLPPIDCNVAMPINPAGTIVRKSS
jgi:hypothetical protein